MRPLLVLCAVASLALPSAAAATTVVRIDHDPTDPAPRAVEIIDETDDGNSMTVSYTNTLVTVEDSSATLEAGRGCVMGAAGEVRCEVDELLWLNAFLRGGADRVTVRHSEPGCWDCIRVRTGAGHDTVIGGEEQENLRGGPGNDLIIGNGGNDVLAGYDGRDRLIGGSPNAGGTVGAGDDWLYGGHGDDELDDGDQARGTIGPDKLFGETGVDHVASYSTRAVGVRVDLRDREFPAGEDGEGDELVNVEIVEGGNGRDRLIGDGDANTLYGWAGADNLRGGGGNDTLDDSDAERNKLYGNRGRDTITVTAFTTGPIHCGAGRDAVSEKITAGDDPPGLLGPWISGTCEVIGNGYGQTWAIDPVPDEPVSDRSIFFDRPAGRGWRPDFHLDLTEVGGPPYEQFGRGESTREGIDVRLPGDVAERARRNGFQFRAEVKGPKQSTRHIVWRFQQKPAR
jgi:hypothetical protein